MLRELLTNAREIPSLKNDQLKHRLSLNTDANNFVSSITGYTPPTTHSQRIGDYFITQFDEKFKQLSFCIYFIFLNYLIK